MNDSTKLAELLRSISASLTSGQVDEAALQKLQDEREHFAGYIQQLDDVAKVRFSAISALLDSAALRIEHLEAHREALLGSLAKTGAASSGSDVPLSKTWGRQDVGITSDTSVPLSKTWGRQDVGVALDPTIPLSKTWGRQDVSVTLDPTVPLSKTWGRQDVGVALDPAIPLSKTWGRQDVGVTLDPTVPLSKTWGRQDIRFSGEKTIPINPVADRPVGPQNERSSSEDPDVHISKTWGRQDLAMKSPDEET